MDVKNSSRSASLGFVGPFAVGLGDWHEATLKRSQIHVLSVMSSGCWVKAVASETAAFFAKTVTVGEKLRKDTFKRLWSLCHSVPQIHTYIYPHQGRTSLGSSSNIIDFACGSELALLSTKDEKRPTGLLGKAWNNHRGDGLLHVMASPNPLRCLFVRLEVLKASRPQHVLREKETLVNDQASCGNDQAASGFY